MTLERGCCRYCRCRALAPCAGGCAWTDATQTLCTVCAGAERIAEHIVGVFATLAEQASARVRFISAPWGDLSLEEQRLLVMTAREVVTLVSEQLVLEDDAASALAFVELGAIADFVRERCPEAVRPTDGVSDVVIRLLAPHVGARVTLA